jgi:hypothetical protein
MTTKREILAANFDEYYELAELTFQKNKFNAATTLFFKSICAGADLIILTRTGEVPTSHTHRFRIVQEMFPELYNIIDKDFSFYQDSYTKKMDKESAEVLRKDVRRIKKMLEK